MRSTSTPLEEFGDVYPMLNISAFFQRLLDPRKIEVSSNLKGALNKSTTSDSPKPTVTITAQPLPAENIQALKDNISYLITKIDLLEGELMSLKKTTITCVKGKITRKVTAVKPVCPKGYEKK